MFLSLPLIVILFSIHCLLIQDMHAEQTGTGFYDMRPFCNKAELATKPLAECRHLVKEENDEGCLFSFEIE